MNLGAAPAGFLDLVHGYVNNCGLAVVAVGSKPSLLQGERKASLNMKADGLHLGTQGGAYYYETKHIKERGIITLSHSRDPQIQCPFRQNICGYNPDLFLLMGLF